MCLHERVFIIGIDFIGEKIYTDTMRVKHKTKNLNIRIAPAELTKLAWLSKLNNKSQGAVVRELIQREYDRIKNAVQPD